MLVAFWIFSGDEHNIDLVCFPVDALYHIEVVQTKAIYVVSHNWEDVTSVILNTKQ